MASSPQVAVATRLWVGASIGKGEIISATAPQSHYLRRVLKISDGGRIAVFNGSDGEWLAEVRFSGRKGCSLLPISLTRPQVVEEGPWLLFAPVKKYRLDFLVQKSVELGVQLICPVQTRRTIVRRVAKKRILANAIEAAEQCGRVTLPEVADFSPLSEVMLSWPQGRTLFWGDESGGGIPALRAFHPDLTKAAFLIGPEGGFEESEREFLTAQAFTKAIDLGPRILRSDTAGLMALSLWQGACSSTGHGF